MLTGIKPNQEVAIGDILQFAAYDDMTFELEAGITWEVLEVLAQCPHYTSGECWVCKGNSKGVVISSSCQDPEKTIIRVCMSDEWDE